MSDKGKVLVAAVLFMALYFTVTAELLDLAPDAVDDMYAGCREKALEKFIHSGLLKQELKQDGRFQAAWNKSDNCQKLLPGGTKEHTTALMTYVDLDPVLLKVFNDAVKTKGTNVTTYGDFAFKAFHFLLMDSISLLSPKRECKTVYVITERKFTATEGKDVRFGEFVLAYPRPEDTDLDKLVIFNITSCFFANLGDNTCKDEDAVLLSPAEVFTVEKVEKISDESNGDYTKITLRHSKLDNKHNCYISSWSPADVPPPKLVLVLLAFSLFFFNS